jgi:hypothetical protein
MSDDDAADLVAYLGSDEIADELLRCGRQRGWLPRVPARRWRSTDGYTNASLATVVIDTGHRADKVVMKHVPRTPGKSDEGDGPTAYANAAADCPVPFRRHLVLTAMPTWPTRNGGSLMFQKLAADDATGCASLADLPLPSLVEAIGLVVDALLGDWNGQPAHPKPVEIWHFLRAGIGPELSSAGSIREWARPADLQAEVTTWIQLPGGPTVYPNPLALAHSTSPLGDARADVIFGRSHQDLHLLNVLVPQVRGEPAQLAGFQIIDLDTYSGHGPLSADSVFLLFSALARHLPSVPIEQWPGLLECVAGTHDSHPDGPLFNLIATVTDRVRDAVTDQGWTEDWRLQFRLSSLALSTYFTTFTMLGPSVRWWFLQLAARLGRDLLSTLKLPVPDTGRALTNPFRDAPEGQLAHAARPAVDRISARAASIDQRVALAWRLSLADPAGAAEHITCAYKEIKRIGYQDAPNSIMTARDLVIDLLEDTAQIFGAEHPTTLSLAHELAGWTYRCGDAATAVLMYQQVAALRAKILGDGDPATQLSRNLGRYPALLDDAAHQLFGDDRS